MIEDEVQLTDVVQQALAVEGIEVAVEHDGPSGLWRARESHFDVVILDIMLPGMNGYVVCRELRSALVGTPILMLTAKNGDLDEAEALELGADDFLRKPFSFAVLIARLRALMRRASAARTDLLTCGTLEVDPRSRTARRDGVPIDLTNREFAVLECLMRADGDVVGRLELLDRVWGDDADPIRTWSTSTSATCARRSTCRSIGR